MLERPLDLLHRHQDLAQLGVHHGLAAVQAGDATDLLGVIHDILHERPQHRLSLLKRRSSPDLLRLRGRSNGSIDAVCGRGVDIAEELSRGRRVALNRRASRYFDARLGDSAVFLGQLRWWHDVMAWTGCCGGYGDGAGGADDEAAYDGCEERKRGLKGCRTVKLRREQVSMSFVCLHISEDNQRTTYETSSWVPKRLLKAATSDASCSTKRSIVNSLGLRTSVDQLNKRRGCQKGEKKKKSGQSCRLKGESISRCATGKSFE